MEDRVLKVSVTIPCRNEEKYIGKCIDSIINQSYGIENIEVLVGDGISDDKTSEIIKEYGKLYPQVRYLLNEKKSAPAAMNLGIKEATGDIIIIFGAHSYMDKDYVRNCVEKLKSKEIHCVGGRVFNISENETAEAISRAMASPFGVGNALFRFSEKEEIVDTVAFGAYKREVFERVGVFDEEFIRNQDDEFNFRVTQNGMKILLSPDITSHYYTRGSFGKLWKQYFQYGFWKVRVIQKHRKTPSIRHLVPVSFVLGLIFGTALSLFFGWARIIFLSVLALYLAGASSFAVKSSKGQGKYVFNILVSFLILHTSYGLGFLEGIFVFNFTNSKNKIDKHTKLSR